MSHEVAFLGGNGHCAARLGPAREAARRLAGDGGPRVVLRDVPYPGFEGRPRAADLETFLDALPSLVSPAALVYATGIGGFLALCLRARGAALRPLVLQAPVLWGLERRWVPRLMRRVPAARGAFSRLMRTPAWQAHFFRRYFIQAHDRATRRAFFEGYAACGAAADLFAWLTPDRLRRLEARFASAPGPLDDIVVWWGERDRVVGLDELRVTEMALGTQFPLRRFPEWGHYPMLDDPDGWVRALAEEVQRSAARRSASP